MIYLTDAPPDNPNGNGHHNGGIPASQIQQVAELRASASVLLQRMQFLHSAGLTFGGNRDVWGVLGYPQVLSTRAYVEKYLRGGIAGRIVDALPNATWRGTVEILEDRDPHKDTEFEKAWKNLDSRFNLQSRLLRVDKLSQLSNYAVLLIGAPGNLEDELPKGKPEQLMYFASYLGGGGPTTLSNIHRPGVSDDADITIYEYETDHTNERFGLPRLYQLRRGEHAGSIAGQSLAVHWSRIIHIADGCLFDDVFGPPSLERVWNLLEDLEKVTGGGAEAFWLRANQGLHLNIDKDMTVDDAKFAVNSLKEQAEDYKHQLTRWLRTRGVDANVLGSDVANFEAPADAIITQIAGSKAIPKRILTGSEMGELASSQDRDNWKDQVNGRQTQYAGPYIVRPLVDRLIKYGYLPTPIKGEMAYEVVWPHIEVLTESEKAEGAAKWASVNQTQGTIVFPSAEIRDHWYGREPITDDQIKEEMELREKTKPPEPEPVEAPTEEFTRVAADRKFSSTEIRLPQEMAASLISFGALIPDHDLASDGRELNPHVTVKFGIHSVDPSEAQALVAEIPPIKFTLGKTALFKSDEYEVLYVAVDSEDLQSLNQLIARNLDVTDTHPTYVPHATIAYLKPGTGARYVNNPRFEGMAGVVNSIVFSPSEGDDTILPLNVYDESEENELLDVLEGAIASKNHEVCIRILGFSPISGGELT